MKKIFLIGLLSLGLQPAVMAQSQEIAQLLLNVEKLAQLKGILTDMKKGYQIVSKGYNGVKDLSQGNFDLHKTFLDALMEVSPTVRKYRKVKDIINAQLILVREYESAYNRLVQSHRFSAAELSYLDRVYDNLFDQSVKNLETLTMVVTAGKLRMNDSERLSAIDDIHADMQDKLNFLRHFNNQAAVLAIQRDKAQNEVEGIQGIYGIKN
jgi:DNA repair ATPase RecN